MYIYKRFYLLQHYSFHYFGMSKLHDCYESPLRLQVSLSLSSAQPIKVSSKTKNMNNLQNETDRQDKTWAEFQLKHKKYFLYLKKPQLRAIFNIVLTPLKVCLHYGNYHSKLAHFQRTEKYFFAFKKARAQSNFCHSGNTT